MKDVPDPDATLEALQPFFDLIGPALEASIDGAVQVFERERLPIDLGLHAYHTRVRILNSIANADLARIGFERREVGAAGLYYVSRIYEIRVLKADRLRSDDGGDAEVVLPTPHSYARSQYYVQPMFAGMAPTPSEYRVRLVAMWDLDGHHQLSEIHLALPRTAALKRGESEHHWLAPVKWGSSGMELANTPALPAPLDDFELPSAAGKSRVG